MDVEGHTLMKCNCELQVSKWNKSNEYFSSSTTQFIVIYKLHQVFEKTGCHND